MYTFHFNRHSHARLVGRFHLPLTPRIPDVHLSRVHQVDPISGPRISKLIGGLAGCGSSKKFSMNQEFWSMEYPQSHTKVLCSATSKTRHLSTKSCRDWTPQRIAYIHCWWAEICCSNSPKPLADFCRVGTCFFGGEQFDDPGSRLKKINLII